jgi:hypothetical protein
MRYLLCLLMFITFTTTCYSADDTNLPAPQHPELYEKASKILMDYKPGQNMDDLWTALDLLSTWKYLNADILASDAPKIKDFKNTLDDAIRKLHHYIIDEANLQNKTLHWGSK